MAKVQADGEVVSSGPGVDGLRQAWRSWAGWLSTGRFTVGGQLRAVIRRMGGQ